MNNDNWLGWILTGIVSIIGALAAAVTTLWSRAESRNAEAIKALEAETIELRRANELCESDRRDLFARVARLEEQVKHLGGKNAPNG